MNTLRNIYELGALLIYSGLYGVSTARRIISYQISEWWNCR